MKYNFRILKTQNCLPLITNCFRHIFRFLLIVDEGEHIGIKDQSLSAIGYQLLPLATSQLVGDNREIDDSGIFEVFYSLLVDGSILPLKIHH